MRAILIKFKRQRISTKEDALKAEFYFSPNGLDILCLPIEFYSSGVVRVGSRYIANTTEARKAEKLKLERKNANH